MKKQFVSFSAAIVAALALAVTSLAQQIADPNFDAKVAKAAYKKKGPKVLFDEAHHNFHTASGRYKPFADLITNDGYRVTANPQKFSRDTLDRPGIDNRQLALNIMHWLSGLLK